MGEKQNNHESDKDGGAKATVTVVLKVEMHCDGCASKIVKFVKSLEGVECVKTEWEVNKLTVTGKVDPEKIQDKLAEKTKKKIDLVSPQPKKEEKKSNQHEPPVSTAVLKLSLHCQGCIDKIIKILGKTDGIHEKSIDKEKDLVTVKGTMDGKALVESLKKNLKRAVEMVPPKKKESKDGGGEGGKKGGAKEPQKMEYLHLVAPGFGYFPVDAPFPQDGYGAPPHPQIFSDDNVNACTVM